MLTVTELTTVAFLSRDEVAYQTARQQRENRIMQNYHHQGITQDYPQYGTDFWGSCLGIGKDSDCKIAAFSFISKPYFELGCFIFFNSHFQICLIL